MNAALKKINVVKLNFNDFKLIWFDELIWPAIIHDLIEYLTGYSLKEYARLQKLKEKNEADSKSYNEALKDA